MVILLRLKDIRKSLKGLTQMMIYHLWKMVSNTQNKNTETVLYLMTNLLQDLPHLMNTLMKEGGLN